MFTYKHSLENLTQNIHLNLYKQQTSHSVKSLERKMETIHGKSLAPADKAANNVIIIWKSYFVELLSAITILRVNMYLSSWRKTKFFCSI